MYLPEGLRSLWQPHIWAPESRCAVSRSHSRTMRQTLGSPVLAPTAGARTEHWDGKVRGVRGGWSGEEKGWRGQGHGRGERDPRGVGMRGRRLHGVSGRRRPGSPGKGGHKGEAGDSSQGYGIQRWWRHGGAEGIVWGSLETRTREGMPGDRGGSLRKAEPRQASRTRQPARNRRWP